MLERNLEKKGMREEMQLELSYELFGQARHQMWMGHTTFSRTTQACRQKFY